MNFTKIKGYSKYEITELGTVRNAETKKILTPEKNGKYVLYPDGDKLKRRVDLKSLLPVHEMKEVKIPKEPKAIKKVATKQNGQFDASSELLDKANEIANMKAFKWIKAFRLHQLGFDVRQISVFIGTNKERVYQDIQNCLKDEARATKAIETV